MSTQTPAPPPYSPPPRRGRSAAGRAVLAIAVLLAGGAVAGLIGLATQQPEQPQASFVIPLQDVQPRSAIPSTHRANTAQLTAWSNTISARTDIPARAVRAYAMAETLTAARTPKCQMSWATIAGLGHIESNHGRYGGARLRADGDSTPPIIGVPLDGSPGVRAIPDTDKGKLDQDPHWDHAVGPMQFLPQTWRKWGVRASGDGAAPDPQNIDDAAATAARYLCLNGRRMGTASGWWSGVLMYNNSVNYGQAVFSAADAYARAAIKP